MNETPPTVPAPIAPPPGSRADAVRIPILISAIFNLLTAIGWAMGCITIVISIPLIVLCIFEFMQHAKLGDPNRRGNLADSTRIIAILEICTIITGNLPSMICGILVLVNLKDLERQG